MAFKRDLHFRLSIKEYQILSSLADRWDESIASVLRRLVREASHRAATAASNPPALATDASRRRHGTDGEP